MKKKSTYIPLLLLIYFIVMAGCFAKDWIRSGRILPFAIISLVELILVGGTYLALRKKEKLANNRPK